MLSYLAFSRRLYSKKEKEGQSTHLKKVNLTQKCELHIRFTYLSNDFGYIFRFFKT